MQYATQVRWQLWSMCTVGGRRAGADVRRAGLIWSTIFAYYISFYYGFSAFWTPPLLLLSMSSAFWDRDNLGNSTVSTTRDISKSVGVTEFSFHRAFAHTFIPGKAISQKIGKLSSIFRSLMFVWRADSHRLYYYVDGKWKACRRMVHFSWWARSWGFSQF